MPIVTNNATVVDIQRLGTIPLKLGLNVYLRDVATIQDDTDITYGYALVNGKKSVYLPDHQDGHGVDFVRRGRHSQVNGSVP